MTSDQLKILRNLKDRTNGWGNGNYTVSEALLDAAFDEIVRLDLIVDIYREISPPDGVAFRRAIETRRAEMGSLDVGGEQ